MWMVLMSNIPPINVGERVTHGRGGDDGMVNTEMNNSVMGKSEAVLSTAHFIPNR